MTTDRTLDYTGVAKLLNVKVTSVRAYHAKAKALRQQGEPPTPREIPAPDGRFGQAPVWRESTIRKWLKDREDWRNRNPELPGPKPRKQKV